MPLSGKTLWLIADEGLTVLVAAIADQPHQIARFRENRLYHGNIAGIERAVEDAGIVRDVIRHAEPCADNHARDCGTIKNIADADIGDTYAMFAGDLLEHGEEFLEQGPSAPGIDHVFVFLQRCGDELG